MKSRPAILRRAMLLLLFVFLGALATVITSWGAAIAFLRFGPPNSFGYVSLPEAWPSWTPRQWPAYSDLKARPTVRAKTFEHRWGTLFLDRTQLAADTGSHPMAFMYVADRFEAGVPLRALARDSGDWMSGGQTGLVRARGIAGGLGPLPLMPLLPGFAIDTFVFAGLIWGVVAVASAVARRARRKPGHCPRCGYDLAGLSRTTAGEHTMCPECGAPAGA